MLGLESREVERKVLAILRVLSNSSQAVGSLVIAQRLKDEGISLTHRAVRYHLKLLDERGLTHRVNRRQGRIITPQGLEELKSALVSDKVGVVINRIELLTYRTTFDPEKREGDVPVNISLFPVRKFKAALEAMKTAFRAGLAVSDLVAVAHEGERLGGLLVPKDRVAVASVCSIVINGVFLKAGIPVDSRFGGVLQLHSHKPRRFVELIEYSGTSLDPSEMFIASRMTNVTDAARRGEGKILANFREIVAPSKPVAERVIGKLKEAGIGGVIMLGDVSQPVCETPVGLNKIGVILAGGLNPVAAAVEAGIEITNRAMSDVLDYRQLRSFWEIEKEIPSQQYQKASSRVLVYPDKTA
ncbi:MAG: NrpR regulatory domain-containing protein [Chloroflexota bacterium]